MAMERCKKTYTLGECSNIAANNKDKKKRNQQRLGPLHSLDLSLSLSLFIFLFWSLPNESSSLLLWRSSLSHFLSNNLHPMMCSINKWRLQSEREERREKEKFEKEFEFAPLSRRERRRERERERERERTERTEREETSPSSTQKQN